MQKVLSNIKSSIAGQIGNHLIKDALTQLEQQNLNAAKEKFAKAIGSDPDHAPQELLVLFQNYCSAKEFPKALIVGEALFAVKLNDFQFMNSLGDVARRAKEGPKARKFYQCSLDCKSNYEPAILNLAALECGKDLYGVEVKRYIASFLSLKAFVLPHYREEALFEENALAHFQKQGKEEPSFEEVATYLKQKIQDDWAKNPTAENKPRVQNSLFNLALYALKNRRGKTARKALERLENQNANIPNMQTMVGLAMFFEGDIKGAVKLLQIELELTPSNRYTLINIALMHFRLGNYLEGYASLIKAREALKDTGGIWDATELRDRGTELYGQEKYSDALKYLSLILEESADKEVLEMVANCHIHLDQPELALARFQGLIDSGTSPMTAKMQLMQLNRQFLDEAKVQFESDNMRKALHCIDNALKIKRSLPTIELAMRIHKKLSNKELIAEFKEEFDNLKKEEEEVQRKVKMQSLLRQGKEAIAQKKVQEGIKLLEASYQMQKNAETFNILSKIYEQLKQNRALMGLKHDWATHVKSQMKHHKFQRHYRKPASLL